MGSLGIDASRAARAQRTGTETYSLEIIKSLAKYASKNLQLRLYTPHPPQHTDWPEATHVETRLIPWPRIWTHLRLATELWQHPPDFLFVPAHVLPLVCPVPAVVTVHDLGYKHYPEAHRPFDRWYLDWTTRRHTQVARHIFADSLATKQDLLDFYQAEAQRISVVYLGRDESLTQVKDSSIIEETKAKYGIDGTYLLYIGTLHPRKNLVRLIKGFHLARPQLPASLKLVIAGRKGWLYDKIFATTQRLGLSEQVIFPGFVDDADKPALLSGALAYVFPSLYEGFGLPVLEAMACHTPVLTSNVSSLPEVAGEAALLVNPLSPDAIAAGLVRLANDSALRQTLVACGLKQIEKFSWDKAARQILEILDLKE